MKQVSSSFTSDMADQYPDLVCGFESPFSSYGGRAGFYGRIETLQCFEDARLLRSRLAEPGHGKVLVVDAGGSRRIAVLGDKMAQLGLNNGWTGVIVNGAIRDCEALAGMDFGVLAMGAVPIRGGFQGGGQCNIALTIAGIVFTPGFYAYCDADGILLSKTEIDPGF
ncbi:putative 4-hydroxy-4-methyl-2-oxoglutarate aldolase [Cupriavidus sp. TA19]|uniref:ribonuclease E activity regulator RraA n=1 Tax=Cupriavidus sp. TA19 TaxID=701108 RepID=UPI00272940BB|nr:ribonuclease E activity regulator RraA [Cupriavidus sp. TA19]GLC97999.1 putative 4-hydroxy-4-methyl-2-oxoglutarate aldolase [Cupriavidus sp. TA19]